MAINTDNNLASLGNLENRRKFLRQLLLAGMVGDSITSIDKLKAEDMEPLVIEGYCEQMSCLPGESVGLCVSTNADTYSVEINRIGSKPHTVWRANGLQGKLFQVPENVAMAGCNWPVSTQVPIGVNWRSGLYVACLKGRSGVMESEERQILIIVRSSRPGKQHQILYQIATNTYQAYNEWGGTNLYSGADFPRVSFNKPFKIYNTPLQPGASWYNPNTSNYHAWDEPFITWAENAGYGIDYCANLDLEFHPEELEKYKLVLSVGHDEYWSAGMRDNLEAFIARGGNVGFFSGNSICWQVRVKDKGRTLECYKRAHDRDPALKAGNHKKLTTLWSEPIIGRPENFLSGVGFPYGGYNGLHGEFMGGSGALMSKGDEPAYIGSYRNVDEFFQGEIDELRIYKSCLDEVSIKKLSQGEEEVGKSMLTAQWDFNGNFINHAASGSWQQEVEEIGAEFRFISGRSGKALSFNGKDQTLRVKSYPGLKPTSGRITFAAWIRPHMVPDGWFIIYRKEDGNARQLFAVGGPGENCGLWCGLGIDAGYVEIGGQIMRDDLLDGKWHHVAATYDGSNVSLFHNGRQIQKQPSIEAGAGEYTVHRQNHWILKGTGLKKGEKFGAKDGIAGYECDGCEFVLKDGLPVATGRDGTPKNFEIVATAPARWDKEEGTLGWAHSIRSSFAMGKEQLVPRDLERDGNACVGTYTRGGTVATVGSCDWSDGLKSGNPVVDRIVRNIMERLST
jgi:hypothetical protein